MSSTRSGDDPTDSEGTGIGADAFLVTLGNGNFRASCPPRLRPVRAFRPAAGAARRISQRRRGHLQRQVFGRVAAPLWKPGRNGDALVGVP
jgi:hypothetical protein